MVFKDSQYRDLVKDCINAGPATGDRTGVGRRRLFRRSLAYDLSSGRIPLDTTRQINWRHGIVELLWMISGSTDIAFLKKNDTPIWNSWAVQEKDIEDFIAKHFPGVPEEAKVSLREELTPLIDHIGDMYGSKWRRNTSQFSIYAPYESFDIADVPKDLVKLASEKYAEIKFMSQGDENAVGLVDEETFIKSYYISMGDQFNEVVRLLKRDPYSSRIVLNVWDPKKIPLPGISPQENVLLGRGALAPCHVQFQCFVHQPTADEPKQVLDLSIWQRSADIILGVPTNLVFYSTLLRILAQVSGMKPGTLYWDGGDVHIYENHVEDASKQVKNEPFDFPILEINPHVTDIYDFVLGDFQVVGYDHHPKIRYPVAV